MAEALQKQTYQSTEQINSELFATLLRLKQNVNHTGKKPFQENPIPISRAKTIDFATRRSMRTETAREIITPEILKQANNIADQLLGNETPDYGNGRKREMCIKHAKNAGKKAKDTLDSGLQRSNEINEKTPQGTITREKVIANSFAFVQMYAVNGEGNGNASCVSTGLYWDRETPMEQTASLITLLIAGGAARFESFGQDKLVAFVQNKESLEAMISKLVSAPAEVYKRNAPESVSKIVQEIQDERLKELNTNEGNGKILTDIFNGDNPLIQAFQPNGKLSFVWGYQREGNDLIGLNADGNPQALSDLAINSPDQPTKDMLLKILEHLVKKSDGENLYAIEFDFSATVACCNTSFNAQQEGANSWEPEAAKTFFEDIGAGLQNGLGEQEVARYPNGEIHHKNDFCSQCHVKKGKCSCKAQEKQKK